MTIEDMKQGVSKIRNPVITRVFRELNLVEQWGSGVRRIFKEAEKLGLPELQIIEIGMRMRFVVPLQQPFAVQGTLDDEQVSEQVSEQVNAILLACRRGDKSKQELLEAAGLANAYLNYKRHIAPLLEKGLIEMTLPDKPQSRLQKYRLTGLGRSLLNPSETSGANHE